MTVIKGRFSDINIGELSDVQAASPSVGDLLIHKGTNWEKDSNAFLYTLPKDFIPSDETWTIQEKKQMVLGHLLTVEGTLSIEGLVRID